MFVAVGDTLPTQKASFPPGRTQLLNNLANDAETHGTMKNLLPVMKNTPEWCAKDATKDIRSAQ
jgi:hypothetical protein